MSPCHRNWWPLGAAASDEFVNPQRNTRQLAEKLRADNVPVVLKMYPDAGHATLIGAFSRPLRNVAPVLDDVAAFVRGDTAPR